MLPTSCAQATSTVMEEASMLGLLARKLTKVCWVAAVRLVLHSFSLTKRVAVILTGLPPAPAEKEREGAGQKG